MVSARGSNMSALSIDGNEDFSRDTELPEDARERKRVLNVLAQRRYRRRKKRKQALLEDMITKVVNTNNETTHQNRILAGQCLAVTPTSGYTPAHSVDYENSLTLADEMHDSNDQDHSILNHTLVRNPSYSWFAEFLNSDNDAVDSWLSSDSTSLSAILQVDDVQNTTFSDDYHLAVPELDLLRASFEIASRMKSAERLFDLQAASIFQDVYYSESGFDLPANLQPTQTQLSVAHHPILDILPWPSVRNKLIQMYSMPVSFWPRHPDDGSECSIIRLVYDMEAGGVRIWGDDPASDESWEVEEPLFAAWWWALDGKVLIATNRRRAARGQRPLQERTAKKTAYTLP